MSDRSAAIGAVRQVVEDLAVEGWFCCGAPGLLAERAVSAAAPHLEADAARQERERIAEALREDARDSHGEETRGALEMWAETLEAD